MKFNTLVVALVGLAIAGCGGSGFTPVPVPPASTAPVIGTIVDQNTSANVSSAATSFAVTSDSTVTFAATSDNQQVVTDAGLGVVASGAGGAITITPVVDTLGNAIITIVATDQAGLSGSASFLVTIVPQQVSVQQFVRAEFMQPEDGNPALINAIAFDQDADNDDFADLLQ